jgi:5-methylcytosine-specific restriction enzyme subunit McrC
VVCGVALGVAARTAGTLTLRQAARGLAGVFPQGTVDRGWARRRMRGAHYHRLNVRYRPAHLWASVLLGGGGIDDFLAEGPWSAGSLLVRTDRIWERAVARACADVDGASAVVTPALPSIRVSEPGAATRVFRPDASVVLPGSVRTPVDAKYKDYAADQVGRDDVHQLLTYAAAAAPSGTDPTAILVHPVVGNPTRRALEVRTGRRLVGRIIAVGLDTRRPPAHSVERLADVLREPVPV